MYVIIEIKSVEDLQRISRELVSPIEYPKWIFRGQKSANGDIKSSLERINEHYLEIRCKREKENDIIKHFQRRAHLYIPSPPKISNYIEWLALIQHYGGPTRLVDFTYSIYIATYFAVEESDCDAAVWALRMNCIPKNPCHDVSKKSFNINELLDPAKIVKPQMGVVHVEPWRLNERNSLQSGTFLCPTDIDKTFKDNLCATLKYNSNEFKDKNAINLSMEDLKRIGSTDDYYSLIKFIIPQDWHIDIIRELYKMNIDSNSLFPGLEGFAKSLRVYLYY